MNFSFLKVRTAALFLGSALTALGFLPEGASEAIVNNAESVVSGVLGVWGVVAAIRVRKEGKAE